VPGASTAYGCRAPPGDAKDSIDKPSELIELLTIDLEREEDGRWIAEISDLPGVMAYGATREQARDRVEALALRTLADRIEHGEEVPEVGRFFVAA